jgi:Raf kinase inhibitor-like YbhB/YbcL family protein
MLIRRILGTALLSVAIISCNKSESASGSAAITVIADSTQSQQANSRSNAMIFHLTSPAFIPNGSIPSKYTCEGADTSPGLAWSGAPPDTKTYVLIVDDPDAPDPAKPQRVYVHWVVYNIPVSVTKLAENAAQTGLPEGAMQGTNDWGKQTYGGPCPPIGRHRYFFKLYALDTELKGLRNPTKAELEKAMEEHLVGNTELVGTYEKVK